MQERRLDETDEVQRRVRKRCLRRPRRAARIGEADMQQWGTHPRASAWMLRGSLASPPGETVSCVASRISHS